MSIASAGALTAIILARIAETAPVISSTLSPRTLSAIRKPPICDGVTSPDSIESNASSASARASVAPAATLAIRGLKDSMSRRRLARPPARAEGRGQVEEVAQDLTAVLARDALGVELDAVDRTVPVGDRHDEAVVGLGADLELRRRGRSVDDERMVARRLERPVEPAKDAAGVVRDARHLAMHRGARPHDVAAERLPDRLVTEADAEDWGRVARGAHEVETDARLVRRAGAGREDNCVRLPRKSVLDADLVVSPHSYVRAQLAEIVDEVEREAVIVVDQRDALHCVSDWVVFSDAKPRPSSRRAKGAPHAIASTENIPAAASTFDRLFAVNALYFLDSAATSACRHSPVPSRRWRQHCRRNLLSGDQLSSLSECAAAPYRSALSRISSESSGSDAATLRASVSAPASTAKRRNASARSVPLARVKASR